jgi:hypothetical protein
VAPTVEPTPPPEAAPTAAQAQNIVTITGDDGMGGMIQLIYVWDDYEARTTAVARLHPPARVALIRRDGNGALIQLPDGTRGWIEAALIKELQSS